MIRVIDYGVANLGSIRNMLRRVGVEADAISTREEVMSASKLILPGIGAFDHGMNALKSRGLDAAIKERVLKEKVSILGICLGAQLLTEGSAEGECAGLGLIAGRCEKLKEDIPNGVRVPHMGWKHLQRHRPSRLLEGLDDDARFYFVHSYHIVCESKDDAVATACHGSPFTAVVERDNVFGAQFHPEKSHRFGMRVLRNFVEL